ncbi:hypothetical protein [Aquamicrobium defluvii]|uniref:4,5-dihydroxyphthalate decarboxylase n=1 Tax=Aquamicrobium defluvii TaxID=69279 RepID=A0A4R6YDC4_9HYPH|nr:hypothetical protein [Aquamicrobium defluvii]TDR33926.1 4,5-dihydroxyphthalate decarboxylase [Aquamicrobium defluvii]
MNDGQASHRLSVCLWRYDRTQPLLDGRVGISGFRPVYEVLDPEKAYDAFLDASYDVIEMSLSYQLTMIASGTARYAALPVFLSRAFRLGNIWVRTDRSISSPRDLVGKTIGAQDYDMTAAVVIRGFLRERHGIMPGDMRWRIADETGTRRDGRPTRNVDGVEIEHATDISLGEMIKRGQLDALISLRTPSCAEGQDPLVVRLFGDYRAEEIAFFRDTNVFPIMHVVGIRHDVAARFPGLPAALYQAFCAAKVIAYEEMALSIWVPKVSLPWISREVEITREVFGDDYWPYGVERNVEALEYMQRLHRQEGLSGRHIDLEELFPFVR